MIIIVINITNFSLSILFRNIAVASHSGAVITPESRTYMISRVIRQVLNKFSKLLPLPRRKSCSLNGNHHRGYASSGIDASLTRRILTLLARRSSSSFEARGNLLLRTASSAKREVYEAM